MELGKSLHQYYTVLLDRNNNDRKENTVTVTFAPCVTCDVRHVMCVMCSPDMTLVQSDIEFQLGSA